MNSGSRLLAAVMIACCMVPVARRLAFRVGAVDQPNRDVRTHTEPTPLLGGIAIALGTLVPLLWQDGGLGGGLAVPLAYLSICCMGIYKDISRRDVDPRIQLLVQFLACWLLVGASDAARDPVSRTFLIIAGVALINAINFLDVVDGLCSCVTGIIAITIFLITGEFLALTLAGGCFGFWLWNRPKARIFMGDLGSFFIGLTLLWLLAEPIAAYRLPVVLLVGVPAAEMIGTFMIRRFRSRALTKGDASHPSLCLLNRGLGPWSLLLLYAGATGFTCFAGWIIGRGGIP